MDVVAHDPDLIAGLRTQILAMFATSLETAAVAHGETARVQQVHDDEMEALRDLHDAEAANFRRALASRDLIGQAKGVLMVTVGCTADEAFELMRARSQHENRKVVDVAAEIVDQAARRTRRHRPDRG